MFVLHALRDKWNKCHLCTELLMIILSMLHVSVSGTWDVYDCIAYPDGMKGVLDLLMKRTGIGTSSTDIFVSDMMAACQLFLPKPDMVLNALCLHVENFGHTAQHFLEEIRLIGESMPFSAMSLPTEIGFSKVSQIVSLFSF